MDRPAAPWLYNRRPAVIACCRRPDAGDRADFTEPEKFAQGRARAGLPPRPGVERVRMAKPPLQLLLASPRGFCAGVDRAIQIVEIALEKFGAANTRAK